MKSGDSGWFPESYVEIATSPGEGVGVVSESLESKTVLEGEIFIIIFFYIVYVKIIKY